MSRPRLPAHGLGSHAHQRTMPCPREGCRAHKRRATLDQYSYRNPTLCNFYGSLGVHAFACDIRYFEPVSLINPARSLLHQTNILSLKIFNRFETFFGTRIARKRKPKKTFSSKNKKTRNVQKCQFFLLDVPTGYFQKKCLYLTYSVVSDDTQLKEIKFDK